MIVLIFMVISIFNADNMFFVFYPCLVVGMIPTNLLAYDERSKWVEYSKVLPYSAFDIVSGKYLIGLIMTVVVVLFNTICHLFVSNIDNIILFIAYMITISLVISSIPITFMFRFGVEKGRMAYYIMIGFFTAMSFVFAGIIEDFRLINVNEYMLSVGMIVIGISFYMLMWYLSIKLYSKNK